MTVTYVECVFCRSRHTARYLCDPVKHMLDAMVARGRSYDMPTLELAEPLPTTGATGDQLLAQLVVQAAVIPAAGTNHPALVLTGRTVDGAALPRWIYPNTDAQLRAAATLVHKMAELAIRRCPNIRDAKGPPA